MNFLDEVEEGMKGRNSGLKTTLSRLSKFINGIQKKTFYSIGAQPKSGKTSLVDELFVLGPYILNRPSKVKWIYFSPEIDLIEKMAKYVAFFMDYKHGVYCDSNYILSRGENRLSEDHKQLVDEIYNNEIIDLFGENGLIDFIEDRTNPEGIRQYILNYAKSIGKFATETYYKDGHALEKIISYKENDSEQYTIIIVDHVGLIPQERGFNKKENIDKLSAHMVWFRNICRFSPVLVSQFNRDLGKVERLKFSGDNLQPTLEDFKDTGSLGEDATMVIGLFNPSNYTHLNTHLGYDLNKIGKNYRSIHVLASRNSEANISVSVVLEGKTGKMRELPKPDEIEKLEQVYKYIERKGLK
jgi:hypothetical protein